MAIGTIGASSGAIEALPAGAVEKLGTFEVGGIASLGTLQPGKYIVSSSAGVRLLERRNIPVTDVQPNGASVFNISEATEIEAELLNPSFSPAPGFEIVDGVRSYNTIPTAKPTNISSSADKQTIAVGIDSSSTYISFDAGETFAQFAQSSSGANSYGGRTNPGMTNYWSGGAVVLDNGILVVIDPNNNNVAKYSSDNGITWNSWSAPYSGTVTYTRHAAMVKQGNFLYLTLRSEQDAARQAIQKVDWSTGSPVTVTGFEWLNSSLTYASARNVNQMVDFGGGYIYSYAYTGTGYQFTSFSFNVDSMPVGNHGTDNSTVQAPGSSSDAVGNFYNVGSEGAFVFGAGDRSSYQYPYIYGYTLYANDYNNTQSISTFGMNSDPFYDTSDQGVGARHSYNRNTGNQNYFGAAGLFSRTRMIARVYTGTLTIYNGSNDMPWYYQIVGDIYGTKQGIVANKIAIGAQGMLPGITDSTDLRPVLINGRWQSNGFKADLQTVSIYRMA